MSNSKPSSSRPVTEPMEANPLPKRFSYPTKPDSYAEKLGLSLKPLARHQLLMEQVQPEMGYDGDFATWQPKAKAKLAALLGLDRILAQPRPELRPRTLWKREISDLGTIEKIAFTSEPGADVIAYLCLPKGGTAPYKFFICLQGHSTGVHTSIAADFYEDADLSIPVEGDRDFGLVCMRYGIASLCIEQRGFGERMDVFHDEITRCQNPAAHALMLGRTLLGERVYDVDRGIDYLLSRGDVDPKFIGVMGNSGGGTATMYAGAMLDRLTHVMPSCAFASFKGTIMSIDHCICNYVPNLLHFGECAEVAGLIAPRPLVIVNGRHDDIFPLEHAQTEFKRLQEIYTDAGAPSLCRHVIGEGGHRFYAEAAWPVMLEYLK